MTEPDVSAGGSLAFTEDRQGDAAVVHVNGRINVDTSPDLRDHLRALLSSDSSPRSVTIDLAGVPYIETSGVATLIEALRIAHHRQIDLRLQGLSGAVLRLFQVTGVQAMFGPDGGKEKAS